MSEPTHSDLVTVGEAARIRGVTSSAISHLVKDGRLRTYSIAGKSFLYRSEVESFVPLPGGWPKGRPRSKRGKKGTDS